MAASHLITKTPIGLLSGQGAGEADGINTKLARQSCETWDVEKTTGGLVPLLLLWLFVLDKDGMWVLFNN